MISLLAGRLDSSILELSQAAAASQTDATIWSDLAAAHLQRGAAVADPYEFVLALSTSNRAVHCNPMLPAARFNRALALEHLSLRDRAAEEWQVAEGIEHDPDWQREAHDHASMLTQPESGQDWKLLVVASEKAVAEGNRDLVQAIIGRFPQKFREYLEENLLSEWAKDEKAHRISAARQTLTVARSMADALAAGGGDRMASRTIAQIELLLATSPVRAQRLVGGFFAYFEGITLTEKGLYRRALPKFQTARKILTNIDSPFALWATFRIALCEYQTADYSQSRIQLRKLTQDPTAASYGALKGRVLLLAGLIEGIEGSQTASLSAFRASESAFRQVRETPSAAKVSGILASSFDVLGKGLEAWRQLYPALIEPTTLDSPAARFSICENASWLAREQGESEIALWFQDEVVRNAVKIGHPDVLIGALRGRASLLTTLGKQLEAASDLGKARSFLNQLSDAGFRRSIEGDLLLAEAEIAGTGSPRTAIAKLDAAIQIFQDTSYHYRIGHALYLRAMAEQVLGNNDGAESDLQSAIAEIESQRETISDPNERISYLDRQRDIFDTMIEFQLERRGKAEAALAYSEQAKARMLWDWIMTGPESQPSPALTQGAVLAPLDLPSLRASLPPRTVMIEYAVLPRKTILWMFRDDDLAPLALTVDITERALGDLVQQLRHALDSRRSAEVETLSRRLYDLLIRPLAGLLTPGERLVLIPDGALHMLPFALLRDRQTGSYLVQDHALTMAPSARLYAENRRRDQDLALQPGRGVLVIAAPDFDHDIDPTLPTLRAGDTDAAIAKMIPGSRVLREGAATRRAFLRSAGDFGILHFGGHSVVNTEFPLLSQMLFAKSPDDSSRGVLHSGEILEQRFPHTRLMVLASCATAAGRVSRTEGIESLAQPFLAAGVPAVVASLWGVGDQGTADFFQRFYRHLAKSSDAAGALQATQLDFLAERPDATVDARIWGAFEVIGGGMSQGNPP